MGLLLSMLTGCQNASQSQENHSSATTAQTTKSPESVEESVLDTDSKSTELAMNETNSFGLLYNDGTNNVNQNNRAIGCWGRTKFYSMLADDKYIYVSGTDLGFNLSGIYKIARNAKSIEYGAQMIAYYDESDYIYPVYSLSADSYLYSGALDIAFKSNDCITLATFTEKSGTTTHSLGTVSLYEIPLDGTVCAIRELQPYDEITIRFNGTEDDFLPKMIGTWLYYETYDESDLEALKTSETAGKLPENLYVRFCRTSIVSGKTEVLFEYTEDQNVYCNYIFDSNGNFIYSFTEKQSFTGATEIHYYDIEKKSDRILMEGSQNYVVHHMSAIHDNYLYYFKKNELQRISLSGGEPEVVFTYTYDIRYGEDVNLNFSGKYIYLYDGDYLYEVEKDNIGLSKYPYIRMMTVDKNAPDYTGSQAISYIAGMWIWDDIMWIMHGPNKVEFTGIELSKVHNYIEQGIDYWTKDFEVSTSSDYNSMQHIASQLTIPALPSTESSNWMTGEWYMDGYEGCRVIFSQTMEIDGVEYWPIIIENEKESISSNALPGTDIIRISEIFAFADIDAYYDEQNKIVYWNIEEKDIDIPFDTLLTPGIHILTHDAVTGQNILDSYK